jgi:hypothetical protein
MADSNPLLFLDPRYRAAFVGAADRALARFETRPVAYRRMVRKMLNLQERFDECRIHSPRLVIPEPASDISDQPLPRLW